MLKKTCSFLQINYSEMMYRRIYCLIALSNISTIVVEAIFSFTTIYQLIASDHVPSKINAIVTAEARNDKMCLSMCEHNSMCLSYAFLGHTNQEGKCKLFDVMFESGQGHTHELKEQKGSSYYSSVAKNCADWYRLGKRQNGIYSIGIVGKYKRKVYCNMEVSMSH